MSYKALWQGRVDEEDGEQGYRWHQVVRFNNSSQSLEADLALIGYPNDSGIAANKGRTGAATGPDALRKALANLPWHREGKLVDHGDTSIFEHLQDTQQGYADKVTQSLNNCQHVIGMGGGHDIAWGSYQGLYNHIAKPVSIGIINLDAHLDLRKPAPKTSSGTPFWQISQFCKDHDLPFHYACLGVSQAANTKALFDYARHTNTVMLADHEFSAAAAAKAVTPMLASVDHLYVTVCLDAFPVSLCPGVSAPSGLGISPSEAIKFIQWLGQHQSTASYKWKLSDIAELNPAHDESGKTARFAARVAFELAAAMA